MFRSSDREFAATPEGVRQLAALVNHRLRSDGAAGCPVTKVEVTAEKDVFLVALTSDLSIRSIMAPSGDPTALGAYLAAQTLRALSVIDVLARKHGELNQMLLRLTAKPESAALKIEPKGVYVVEPAIWWRDDEPLFAVELNALGDNLRQGTTLHYAEDAADLERWLDALQHTVATRVETSRRLRDVGATGKIDEVALRSVLSETDPAVVFEALSHADTFTLETGVVLSWADGRVTSRGNLHGGLVRWVGTEVRLTDTPFSETTCLAAIGRPITDIIDHPPFSRSMIISEMEWNAAEDEPHTLIRLADRNHFFCGPRGTHWPVS